MSFCWRRRKRNRAHTSSWWRMREGRGPALSRAGREATGTRQRRFRAAPRGEMRLPKQTKEGKRRRTATWPRVGLAERAGQRALVLNVHLQRGRGPGAMRRGSAVGSVAPSQEGADLSQGCCCDLKTGLAGATEAEAWRSSHTTSGLWVTCPPSLTVAGLTDIGCTCRVIHTIAEVTQTLSHTGTRVQTAEMPYSILTHLSDNSNSLLFFRLQQIFYYT